MAQYGHIRRADRRAVDDPAGTACKNSASSTGEVGRGQPSCQGDRASTRVFTNTWETGPESLPELVCGRERLIGVFSVASGLDGMPQVTN